MRLLLCLSFLSCLILCAPDGYSQARDSTQKKISLFQRRRQQLEQYSLERAERQRQWAKLPLTKADSPHRWNLSFNPLGLVELQMALGVGVGYQVTDWWQIWLESSALCQFYQKPPQSCIGGVREILAMKFYFGPRRAFFTAAEFRWKQVYYHDVGNFVETTYPGVGALVTQPYVQRRISNYTYQLENVVFGGAVWFGGRVRISGNHRWRLEPSIGVGFKGRTVSRYGVPAGYVPETGGLENSASPWPWSPKNSSPFLIYLPASLRIVYVL